MKTDQQTFLEMIARAGITPCFSKTNDDGSTYQFDNGGWKYAASLTFDANGNLTCIVGCA